MHLRATPLPRALRAVTAGSAALAVLAAGSAAAQNAADHDPARVTTIVYPFAAGGIGDTSARILAEYLRKHLGPNVIVENKPGAGGAIGAVAVIRARPDGYTLLAGGASALVYTPLLDKDTQYNPLVDFRPVGFVDRYDLVMVTGKPTGYTSVKAVIDAARALPGPMVFGATGNGTSPNLAATWLAKISNVRMEPANYKGTAPAIPDAIAGRIPFIFMSPQSASQHVKAGNLIGLAITSKTRDRDFPQVPTFAEAGFPDFHKLDWGQWNGVFVSTAVPLARAQVLNAALQKTMNDAELQARYAKLGTTVYPAMSLEQSAEFFKTQMAQWSGAVKDMGAAAAK